MNDTTDEKERCYKVTATVTYTIFVDDTNEENAREQAVQIPFSQWVLDHFDEISAETYED